ncbi:hypothetical protein CBR_g49652 [Chara braunii]|uniref:EF-hand domain-containing protein n=1 Tax=Chara braunii TaxID=69332 RepID=A0A388M5H0_CHABU|nr:hypothetical protein CBR_g49652 [Chara braunii]|eukprot:GBG89801.1 hypothetical protein CBR_g49652 [Chara braunii]
MASLSESQLKDFREVFDLFDKDNNGKVTTSELGNIMKSMGVKASDADVEALVKEADADDSHSVEWNEFIRLMERQLKAMAMSTEQQLLESFKIFDKSGDGKITAKEVREVLVSMGERVTGKDVDELMKMADVDGDGYVDFKEFAKSLGATM